MVEAVTEASNTSSPSEFKKTYYGNCHCGRFVYHIDLPPLEMNPPTGCQCTICIKKGYLFVFAKKSNLIVERGGGEDGLGKGVLKDYGFNSGQCLHRFCPTCGSALGIISSDESHETFPLNIRLLRDVDIWSLKPKIDPGPVTPLQYTAPVFPGLEDLKASCEEGEKVYPGSCHCGAVTFGVRTRPLADKEVEVKQCDCSYCLRYGDILTYPPQLHLAPYDESKPNSLVSYTYAPGRKYNWYQFCGHCGVSLFLQLRGPPEHVLVTRPEAVQDHIRMISAIRPVSLRSMDFFLGRTEEDREEWKEIEKTIVWERGSKQGPWVYEVPDPEKDESCGRSCSFQAEKVPRKSNSREE